MVVIVPSRDLTKEARAYPSSPDVTRMKPRYLLGFLDLRLERVSNSSGVQPQTRSMNVCASRPALIASVETCRGTDYNPQAANLAGALTRSFAVRWKSGYAATRRQLNRRPLSRN